MPRLSRPALISIVFVHLIAVSAFAHDIPNARIDRSTQIVLSPLRLQISYEISLAELTLAQDLRQLDGESFVGDRIALFERYAKVVGPLNARGFTIQVDRREIELQVVDFSIRVEDHLRITFRFESAIPAAGRLVIQDNNYVSSAGSTRLALRTEGGVEVQGVLPPRELAEIPWQQTWQLTDAEERATKRIDVLYQTIQQLTEPHPPGQPRESSHRSVVSLSSGLSRLLDQPTGGGQAGWLVTAFLLGMMHAIQPGHGKTLVAAGTLDGPGAIRRGVGLGLLTATTHLASVVALAGVLWWIQTSGVTTLHLTLTRGSGILIALVGFFRVGRHLAAIDGTHDHWGSWSGRGSDRPNPWLLGLAAGAVPCWDAVALVIMANALGQLRWGLTLLVAFSGGLAMVLVAVGWVAGRMQRGFVSSQMGRSSFRWLGLSSGLLLVGIGLSLIRV